MEWKQTPKANDRQSGNMKKEEKEKRMTKGKVGCASVVVEKLIWFKRNISCYKKYRDSYRSFGAARHCAKTKGKDLGARKTRDGVQVIQRV